MKVRVWLEAGFLWARLRLLVMVGFVVVSGFVDGVAIVRVVGAD